MKIKNDWLVYGITIVLQLIIMFFLANLISAKTKILVEQKNKLTAFEKRNESIAKLTQDYLELDPQMQLLDKALPDKDHLVDLIAEIEKQASASGAVTKIDFSKESVNLEAGGIKSFNISLQIRGTYFQILDLVKKIEKIPQIISFNIISLQSPKGLEGENEAIITMKCYLDPNF